MKILQVSHGFPPLERAGAEVFTRGLSLALVARGHRVAVFHARRDEGRADLSVESLSADGLEIERLYRSGPTREFTDTYSNAAVAQIFDETLARQRPDVVHFHHVIDLGVDVVEIAARRGVPVVFTLHDYWLECQRGQFLKPDLSLCEGQDDRACARCFAGLLSGGGAAGVARGLHRVLPGGEAGRISAAVRAMVGPVGRLFVGRQRGSRDQVAERMARVRAMCDRVDLFLSPSRYLLERFVAFGLPEERLCEVAVGIDVESCDALGRHRGDGVRFGYLGTWTPPKGLDVLLRAFALVDDERATLHLHGRASEYDGDSSYGERLEALGGPRVVFHGPYENHRAGEILADLDVLVFPSIWFENSPLTLQEASLARVPVIASDLGAIPERVVDGRNGLLFRPRDAEDLARTMRRFLDEDGLLESLSESAGGGVTSFAESAREHEALYDDLVSSRARHRATDLA